MLSRLWGKVAGPGCFPLPDLNDLNETLEALSKLAISTTQGEFVRMDDVKRLIRERNAAASIEKKVEQKAPKTMVQAKQAVLKDEEVMKNFPPPQRAAGKSLSAQDTGT